MPIRPENLARYPADWAEISFRIRFVRALGHCECEGECGRGHKTRCPARHNAPAPGTGTRVILTVAHLDHTPENCDPANLKAMCQGCHLHYDRAHHAETAARTRAAEIAAHNTPLPGLEPPAPEPKPEPAPAIPAAAAKPKRPRIYATNELADYDTWAPRGACRDPVTDAALFFSGKAADATAAKAVCIRCPVTAACLAHALRNAWLWGVWGGTTNAERDEIRRR